VAFATVKLTEDDTRAATPTTLTSPAVAGTGAATTVPSRPATSAPAGSSSASSGAPATTSAPAAPGTILTNAQILAKVGPSVVAIEVELGRGQSAAGSGVIISADGLVLTNAHVVRGATTIAVKYADGTTQDADLVGSASSKDIALIRIRNASALTPAVLGSSAALNVGDDVIAIGNALDLGDTPTVTRGIVSAKGRSLDNGEIQLENLLQTDAAINHGNSGGPLVNMQGEVIGINSAGIENTNNLGFAIEIDAVKPVIEDLKNGGGTAAIAYLGVQSLNPDELDPTTAEQLGVTGVTSGVIVAGVGNGSPAQTAGLRAGDVIVAIDGTPATSKDDVRKAIQARKPGDKLTIEVQRDGQARTITATLGSRPAN
jgi:S1-C subfamily serine protease